MTLDEVFSNCVEQMKDLQAAYIMANDGIPVVSRVNTNQDLGELLLQCSEIVQSTEHWSQLKGTLAQCNFQTDESTITLIPLIDGYFFLILTGAKAIQGHTAYLAKKSIPELLRHF